jgi:hypothetical protein
MPNPDSRVWTVSATVVGKAMYRVSKFGRFVENPARRRKAEDFFGQILHRLLGNAIRNLNAREK